jgi:hypothetical protein
MPSPTPSTSTAVDAKLVCPAHQYVCGCGTAAFCLKEGTPCYEPEGNSTCWRTPPAPLPEEPDAAPTSEPPEPDGTKCGALQHECGCATGSYCVAIGAVCIEPEMACPPPEPSPGHACGALEHPCLCATGSYCLPANAMCRIASTPCPGTVVEDAGAPMDPNDPNQTE